MGARLARPNISDQVSLHASLTHFLAVIVALTHALAFRLLSALPTSALFGI